MEDNCKNCGTSVEKPVVGVDGGAYCMDCYGTMPVCDDCDMIIEDGDYHLCSGCRARRDALLKH